ncbi:unnamed protein product [Candidula unifasciata]|uniref:Uncharacterized protein n=1 Tax=Candidula unifasciata TaxID=100452 RepID=A0A8S3ZME7_9EUPU|nr:unnamed protein product [Candidula unifasciata]
MYNKIFETVLSLTLVSLCMGTEGRNLDNEYLRFGRQHFNGYMRFGRAAHGPSEDTGNYPFVAFGNGDDLQQESNPLQTIASLNDRENLEDGLPELVSAVRMDRRSRDPFLRFGRGVHYLRFGRAVPYLRFGKRNFPYPRFGRSFPSLTNQALEPFSSSEKSHEVLHQPEDVALLTGPGLSEETYGADRKRRSVDSQGTQAPVKTCMDGIDTSDSETSNIPLDQLETRDTRSQPYMRFGKKRALETSNNNKYTWDKQLELYTKNQADKRKQEYMRFGRSKEESSL